MIGNLTVDRIRREDVLRVLTPIWTQRPETARAGAAVRDATGTPGAVAVFRTPWGKWQAPGSAMVSAARSRVGWAVRV